MKIIFLCARLRLLCFNWRTRVLVALLLVLSGAASSAAIIFSENMGTTAPSSGSSFPSVSTFVGFQNSGTLAFSGSGDVRATTTSSGIYTTASGSDNVFLTSGGTVNFQMASINTVGYTSLILSFGAFKSAIASTMSELALSYSTDGINYSTLSIPAQASGGGTANWRLISGISLPSDAAGVADLRLQWINTAASSVMFRLDDVTLTGTAVPEPAEWGLISALELLGICGFSTWRKQYAAKRMTEN
jgi:hypothetical protein